MASGTGSMVLVLVSYRSEPHAERISRLLASWLVEQPKGVAVVLDNSGSQEFVEQVRAHTAAVADRLDIAVAVGNAGFAPTVNAAVQRARDRWGDPERITLLNPDVDTTAQTLLRCQAALDDPTIGVAAALLIDGRGRQDAGSARRSWNRRRLFAEVVGLPSAVAAFGTRARGIPVSLEEGSPTDVDIASGAFMVIRADVFADGLDTRLPMYLEDQEICWRTRRAGLRVVVLPGVVALHIGGESRRANTRLQRELRMMELAAAPAVSLMDSSGAGFTGIRLVIAGGGLVRGAIAGAALAVSPRSSRRRSWARSQLLLSHWFVSWAKSTRDPLEHGWTMQARECVE